MAASILVVPHRVLLRPAPAAPVASEHLLAPAVLGGGGRGLVAVELRLRRMTGMTERIQMIERTPLDENAIWPEGIKRIGDVN